MNSNFSELFAAFNTGLITDDIQVDFEYRIYYNIHGEICKSTALKTDPIENDNYIIVDKNQFNNCMGCIVKDGKLQKIEIIKTQTYRLQPATQGFRVVKNNPCLLLLDNENIENCEFYDYRIY